MSDETSNLTRRKVLGSLGTIGSAAALGGAATTAGFTDQEALRGWLSAGEVDLLLDFRTTYYPWERFDIDPEDPLVDGNYENGEAVPIDGQGMGYVIGQAPDFRVKQNGTVDGDDPAPSGEVWAALVDQIDECEFEDPTDITGEQFTVDDTEVGVYGTPAIEDDTYYPGYVDGSVGMHLDLFDVKPLDHGETTISLRVCDNPSIVWFRAIEADEANADSDVDINDPESEIDTGEGVWAGGELDDFLWVKVWYDGNCDNRHQENEPVLYEGSLRGLIETTEGGVQLNPFQQPDLQNEVLNSQVENGIPITETQEITVPGNPRCENLNDLYEGVSFEELIFVDSEDVPTSATEDVEYENSCTLEVDFEENADGDVACISDFDVVAGDCEVCAVIVKGGRQGANVYVFPEPITDLEDADVDELCTPENPSGLPAGISNISFCTCDVDGNGNGNGPPVQEVPLCIEETCLAYKWKLPQDNFEEFDSDVAQAESWGETLADEIVGRFDLSGPEEIDVNAVQTDEFHFDFEFAVEQCRHHTMDMNGDNTADGISSPWENS